MSMNVGPSSGEDEVVSTINTTPLVDVMLEIGRASCRERVLWYV